MPKIEVKFIADIPNPDVRVCDNCKYLYRIFSPSCLLGDKKLQYNNELSQVTRPKGCRNSAKEAERK